MSQVRVLSLLFAALSIAACEKAASTPAAIQRHVALQTAASCDELSGRMQDAAVRLMRAQIDALKNGPMIAAAPPGGPANTAGGSPAPTTPPASYTTTNTHVAGVDEADFMKNDGTRIFTLSGGSLNLVKSWPPQDLSFTTKLPIEGWPTSMFLEGNSAAVISQLWSMPDVSTSSAPVLCPPCQLGSACVAMYCGGEPVTKVTTVDVSDSTAFKVTSERYFGGYAVSSRRVASSMRLVLSESMQWPEGVKWWIDWKPSYASDHGALVAAYDALEDANEKIIRAAPVDSFFPPGKRKLADGTLVDLSHRCTDFYLSNSPERPGVLTVATVDLANPAAEPQRTSVFAEPGIVYATTQHLYVASQHWWWWDAPGQESYTYIHEFDISDPVRTTYQASGGVTGTLRDEFALDESGGYLRVATTTSSRSIVNGSSQAKVGNHVMVLAPQSDQLAVIGDTGDLVASESIRGVRFAGDKAFVVTFRGIDPLVTVDLTDPAHPRKVAELTIPGFSTYLQLIDEGHLLAIGTDLPVPDPVTGVLDWSRRAMQLSVFDVSDLAHPTRTAQLLVGTMNGWSEAAYDHHAFNWYAQRSLLAIPFSDWLQTGTSTNWYDHFVSDVRIFRVDASTGITSLGSLGMSDVYIEVAIGDWSYRYVPWVRRSVLATDDAGRDYVYAVSDSGIRVANLADLAHPVATVVFPQH